MFFTASKFIVGLFKLRSLSVSGVLLGRFLNCCNGVDPEQFQSLLGIFYWIYTLIAKIKTWLSFSVQIILFYRFCFHNQFHTILCDFYISIDLFYLSTENS